MISKYVNPFTDFGFKKIFGEEASKPLLLDFLNALLPQQNNIIDLTFKNAEQLGQTEADRKAIYDIYCETDKGEKFIVELQKAKQNLCLLNLVLVTAHGTTSRPNLKRTQRKNEYRKA